VGQRPEAAKPIVAAGNCDRTRRGNYWLMDDRRLGLSIRALRERRRWRQGDLAAAVGLSQSTISFVERGHLDGVTLQTMRRIGGALDASVSFDFRWRNAALDRLLDERHAIVTAAGVRELRAAGWEVEVEVSYAHFGERGSIDVLGGGTRRPDRCSS
jgi:transcriptional regulator with XRE-family HTH domain